MDTFATRTGGFPLNRSGSFGQMYNHARLAARRPIRNDLPAAIFGQGRDWLVAPRHALGKVFLFGVSVSTHAAVEGAKYFAGTRYGALERGNRVAEAGCHSNVRSAICLVVQTMLHKEFNGRHQLSPRKSLRTSGRPRRP